MFNIVASELIFAVIFLAVVLWTWPSPPWKLLQYGGIVLMLLAPLLFYPFSKTSPFPSPRSWRLTCSSVPPRRMRFPELSFG
jgi:hypothetical protein